MTLAGLRSSIVAVNMPVSYSESCLNRVNIGISFVRVNVITVAIEKSQILEGLIY